MSAGDDTINTFGRYFRNLGAICICRWHGLHSFFVFQIRDVFGLFQGWLKFDFFFCAWLVFLIRLSRSKQTVPPVTRRDGVRCWLVDPLRQSWIFALKLPTPSNLIATATLAAAAELFLDAQMRLDIGRALEHAGLSFDRCAAQQLKKDCWWEEQTEAGKRSAGRRRTQAKDGEKPSHRRERAPRQCREQRETWPQCRDLERIGHRIPQQSGKQGKKSIPTAGTHNCFSQRRTHLKGNKKRKRRKKQ